MPHGIHGRGLRSTGWDRSSAWLSGVRKVGGYVLAGEAVADASVTEAATTRPGCVPGSVSGDTARAGACGAPMGVRSRALAPLRADPGYPVRERAGTGHIGLLPSVAEARIVPRISPDLALLIHAQHHRLLRRVVAETDDVHDLLRELRVRRQPGTRRRGAA